MTTQQYITPENITLAAGVAGGIVALALLGLLIWNRRSISKGIADIRQSIFSQGGLFYIGMGLFMLASVVEAGPVINKIVMHDALWGYGGHMLVFAFDMISAVSLRARLNAKRVFDSHGMRVQMWGIVLPAIVSIVANFAGALQSFNQDNFSHLWIFAWGLPLIGAVFPSMIIVLSLAADHLLDTTAISDKIDPEEFKKQEKKRIDILKIRLTTEQDLLQEEAKIASIRSARDVAQGRASTSREWFFLKWIRPYVAPPMTAIKSEIEKAVGEAQQQLNSKEIHTSLASITEQLATIHEHQQLLAQQVSGQNDQLTTFKLQFEGVARTVTMLTASMEQQVNPNEVGASFSRIAATQEAITQHISKQSEQLQQLNQSQREQQQQLTSFKADVEGVTSTIEGLTTSIEAMKGDTLKVKQIASTVGDLSASIEAVRNEVEAANIKASKTQEASTSKRAKAMNLPLFEASSEGVALQDTGETTLTKRERASMFIANYQRQHEGTEPSLEEIMTAVDCSQGSASNYRADYRKTLQAQMEEMKVTASATNGHHAN